MLIQPARLMALSLPITFALTFAAFSEAHAGGGGDSPTKEKPAQAKTDPDPPDFVTIWEFEAGQTLRLPLGESGTYDFPVHWGDGTSSHITSWDQPEASHTYEAASRYAMIIEGTIDGWRLQGHPNARNLIGVFQWGDFRFGNQGGAFAGASNLHIVATDIPNLEGITNLSHTFHHCSTITSIPAIDEWDVSSVTDMKALFFGASEFRAELSNWDVSSVTNMMWIFRGARAFNGDISGWDVSSVTTLDAAFHTAQSFNQDITGWDVSSVTDMRSTFHQANSFDQPIGRWDVSSVTKMAGMFSMNQVFNQDLSAWDVSSVTDMTGMFQQADRFNQDLSSWDISSVESTLRMFAFARSFDQDVESWGWGLSAEDLGVGM